MAQINYIRTSFIGGEVTEQAAGRTDTTQSLNSCKQLTNFLPTAYGSIIRTPGTKYLAESYTSGAVSRLIPFQTSDNTSYLIELASGGYFRVFQDDSIIYPIQASYSGLTNPSFATDLTSWTTVTSGSGTVTWNSGSARSDKITGASCDIYQDSSLPAGNYSVEFIVVENAGTNTLNFRVGKTASTYNDLVDQSVSSSGTYTYTFSLDSTSTVRFRVNHNGSGSSQWDIASVIVTRTSDYNSISHPYSDSELQDLQFAQNNDVVYLVHPDVIPKRLVKRTDATAWTLDDYNTTTTTYADQPGRNYTEGPYLPLNTSTTTLSMGTTSGSVTVTASASLFASTDVGRMLRWRSQEPTDNGEVSFAGNGTQKNFDFTFSYNTSADVEVYSVSNVGVYTLQTNPTNYTVSGQQVVFGTAPAAGTTVVIRRKNLGSGVYGYGTITAYTSSTQVIVTTTADFDIASKTSTDWFLGAFSDTTGYPRAVAFHDQRLWFGGTYSNPDMLWSSAAGNYQDFRPDSSDRDGVVLSISAMTLVAANNKVSNIKWLAARVNLIVGGSSSLYEIRPQDTGMSATSLPAVLKLNEYGVGDVVGQVVNTSILYTSASGTRLYSADFSNAVQAMSAADLSILAPQRLSQGVSRIAYQEIPDSVFWFVMDDGTVSTCTYKPQEQGTVAAFAEQTFDGVVKDVVTLYNGTSHDVYFLIERTIDASTVYYIEKLADKFVDQDAKYAWHVQSGTVTSNVTPFTTVTGLDHLEGETVAVWADGAPQSNKVVSSGSITITSANYAIVGLPMTSTVITGDFSMDGQTGSMLGNIRRVRAVTLQVYKSGTMLVSTETGSQQERIHQYDTETLYSTGNPLMTGRFPIQVPSDYDYNCRLVIETETAAPLHIQSLLLHVDVGGNK